MTELHQTDNLNQELPTYEVIRPGPSGKQVQLWIGPQHPGITGNMAVQAWLEGDTITRGVVHVGYLHRAFEKLMERRTFYQAWTLVCRICVPEPDTNEYLMCAAFEELSGLDKEVPERAQWIRTLVMEMSRLGTMLMIVGGQVGAMGLGAAPNWLVALRDYILDRFEELSGGRVYHMYVIFGGVRLDLPDGFAERMEQTLRAIEERLPMVDKLILESAVFRQRAEGVGVVPPEWVDEMGLSGTIARAMGLARDVRKDHPYLVYPDLDFDVVTEQGSDIFARTQVRRREIEQSIDLIRQILGKMPDGPVLPAKTPNMLKWKIEPGQTYVRAESTRGEYGFFAVTDGSNMPRRVHVRGPSYIHGVSLLEKLLPGTNISDVYPLMVSLQVCPPEIER